MNLVPSEIDPWVLLDSLPEGMVLLDSKRLIQYLNATWHHSIGGFAVGQDFCQCLAPLLATDDDRQRIQQGIDAVLQGEQERFLFEYPLRQSTAPPDHQQEPPWFLLTIVPRLFQGVRYALVSYQDITHQKQVELALRSSEARFGAVFHDSLDVILILDGKRGQILNVSPVVRHTLGYSPSELIGKHFSFLCLSDEEETEQPEHEVLEQIRTHGTVFESQHFVHCDGTVLPMDLTATMIPLATSTAIVATLRDASERKEAENERERSRDELSQINLLLRQEIEDRSRIETELAEQSTSLAQQVEEQTRDLRVANIKLERAARHKDEFLASMSHELRTPLNAVLGLSEALLEEVYGTLTEKQRSSLRSIEESGRHLLALINDMLDLAKIEAGRIDLEFNTVSIQEVCQASLRLIRNQALKKHLGIAETFDPNVTTLQADERRLKQILVNLLSNAVKFTPEGGHIGLEVAGDRDRYAVHITVWDTGIGIAPDDMGRLFQPFVQVDSSLSRPFEGTGLGLVLVARLAEMHGGSVTVESDVGQGSRFTVSLPLSITNALDATATSEEEETTCPAPAPPQHHAHVLIAEDNEDNIAMLSDYLRTRGYEVTIAHHGVEALELARQSRPDIILMDIQMPVMNGIEAIRHIRADDDLKAIPIVALTALAMSGDRESCLEAGANDYMSKPVSLRELLQTIEALLS